MYDYSYLEIKIVYNDNRITYMIGTCSQCEASFKASSVTGPETARQTLRGHYRNHKHRVSRIPCTAGIKYLAAPRRAARYQHAKTQKAGGSDER